MFIKFRILRVIGESASHLQVLDLGNNRLSGLGVRSFRGLDFLVHLDLSGNSIVDVADGSFNGLGRLTRLDLRDNQLTTLTASTLRGQYLVPVGPRELFTPPQGVFNLPNFRAPHDQTTRRVSKHVSLLECDI